MAVVFQAAILFFMATFLPEVQAAHGLDNNWTVTITGMKDSMDCVRISSIMDLGVQTTANSNVQCVKTGNANHVCVDDYDCDTARRPQSFQGCTFDSSTATTVTLTGVVMDGLCYNNFVRQQKNFNGAPGLAPDKVHVRSEAEKHTRACLVVDYCAETGYYLVHRTTAGGDYVKLAQMESGENGAPTLFDWLIRARHSCGSPPASPSASDASLARPMQAALLGVMATLAA